MATNGSSWLRTDYQSDNPLLKVVADGLNIIGRWGNRMRALYPIVVERQGGGILIRHAQAAPTPPADEDCVVLGCWDPIGEAVSEGEETPDTTSYAVGEMSKPIRIYAMTRVGYYHAGDQKFYGYVRALTLDQWGHWNFVSGETRVEVDVPVLCESGS